MRSTFLLLTPRIFGFADFSAQVVDVASPRNRRTRLHHRQPGKYESRSASLAFGISLLMGNPVLVESPVDRLLRLQERAFQVLRMVLLAVVMRGSSWLV